MSIGHFFEPRPAPPPNLQCRRLDSRNAETASGEATRPIWSPLALGSAACIRGNTLHHLPKPGGKDPRYPCQGDSRNELQQSWNVSLPTPVLSFAEQAPFHKPGIFRLVARDWSIPTGKPSMKRIIRLTECRRGAARQHANRRNNRADHPGQCFIVPTASVSNFRRRALSHTSRRSQFNCLFIHRRPAQPKRSRTASEIMWPQQIDLH